MWFTIKTCQICVYVRHMSLNIWTWLWLCAIANCATVQFSGFLEFFKFNYPANNSLTTTNRKILLVNFGCTWRILRIFISAPQDICKTLCLADCQYNFEKNWFHFYLHLTLLQNACFIYTSLSIFDRFFSEILKNF